MYGISNFVLQLVTINITPSSIQLEKHYFFLNESEEKKCNLENKNSKKERILSKAIIAKHEMMHKKENKKSNKQIHVPPPSLFFVKTRNRTILGPKKGSNRMDYMGLGLLNVLL